MGHFEKICSSLFDGLLDRGSHGPLWLREPEIAKIVQDALLFRDRKVFTLIAHSIMPNHVHMVFEPTNVGRLARL
ncbi:MAG: hypothetical protein ABSB78_04530 [Bacteroidota bacterium]